MSTHSVRQPAATDREDPDERAMTAVAKGDGEALRGIFDRWKLPILNYLYRSLGNHADAEDLTLAVFTEVWRAAPRYRNEGTFSAWLFAIARGKLRHEWRRQQRKPLLPAPAELMDIPDPDSGTEQDMEQWEWEETLLEGLQTLPENQRNALLLSVHSPMDSGEIASSLGVRPSHLYVLIHRARETLKKHFRKHHENR